MVSVSARTKEVAQPLYGVACEKFYLGEGAVDVGLFGGLGCRYAAVDDSAQGAGFIFLAESGFCTCQACGHVEFGPGVGLVGYIGKSFGKNFL